MILSDEALRRLMDQGDLTVSPLSEHAIQPGSIDCRLGSHFLLIEQDLPYLTLDSKVQYRSIDATEMEIPPKSFLLATTMEFIKLPLSLSAFVEGRSSIGRMGLFIQNAGWVDAGFSGNITLELYNANPIPIRLQAGRRICQLVFCQMDPPAKIGYNGKYLGQTRTVGSRIDEDLDSTIN